MPTRAKFQLHHGEALEVLRSLPSDSVDAVITDPPYSSGGLHAGARMLSPATKYVQTGTKLQRPDFLGDNRDQRSFAFWSTLWMSECLRIAKPGAPLCVFTDWRQLPTTTDVVQAGGWMWRGIVVWDKGPGARPQAGFRNQAEYVAWGSKGAYKPDGKPVYLPGVLTHSVRRSDKHHIAGKPTELMAELVKVCPEDGVVLDPFAGSGTTGVAALAAGRRFIGAELSPAYHEIATERLASVRDS